MILVSAWYLGGFSRLDYEVPPNPDFTLEDEDLNSRRLKKESDVNKQSKSPKGKAKESGGRSNKSSVTKGGKSKKKSSTKKGSSSSSSAAPSGAPSEAPFIRVQVGYGVGLRQFIKGQLVPDRRRLGTIVCPYMNETEWDTFINGTETESCAVITASLNTTYGDDVTLSECRVGPNPFDGCKDGEEGA